MCKTLKGIKKTKKQVIFLGKMEIARDNDKPLAQAKLIKKCENKKDLVCLVEQQNRELDM